MGAVELGIGAGDSKEIFLEPSKGTSLVLSMGPSKQGVFILVVGFFTTYLLAFHQDCYSNWVKIDGPS